MRVSALFGYHAHAVEHAGNTICKTAAKDEEEDCKLAKF